MFHHFVKVFVFIFFLTLFSSTGIEAMNIRKLGFTLNIELNNNRDLIDLAEWAKKPGLRKMPNYKAFGLPVPEKVIDEALNFASVDDSPLSHLVLRYPYIPLVVLYWDALMLYNHGENKKYPTFGKFIESFSINIVDKFKKAIPDSSEGDFLYEVRNPGTKGVVLSFPDILQIIHNNQNKDPDYDIRNVEIFLTSIFLKDYYAATDFSLYDIMYDILYNNIASILAEAYKTNTIKTLLPLRQLWFEYKVIQESWRRIGGYPSMSSPNAKLHSIQLPYKIVILYPRFLPEADIRDIYIAKARSEMSAGLGIGYDELYEFLVDNKPDKLQALGYQYLWRDTYDYETLKNNNIKHEINNIFYEWRYYHFDASANGEVHMVSLWNMSENTFDFAIYNRYAAIQCVNMLFFHAFATNR